MLIYTVQNRDSLYTIAQRFDADAELIASDNELTDPDALAVGQTLVIRNPQILHTVKEGENLYSVAQNYGVTTNQLWRNNPKLVGGTALSEGERIVISDAPPTYGDTIATNAYVYPSVSREVLLKTLPYLTYLTVFSYGIEDDGELGELEDEEIIELARQYGVAPIMHISSTAPDGNYSPELVEKVLSDRVLQDRLIGGILRKVTDKRYKGVMLDFEYVPAEYSEEYALLLARLDEKLGSGGYPIWSALAAKTEETRNERLCEGHGYEAIGKAVDKVLLQTYGWGSMYGEPMAIAPLDKVREVAEYASDRIEADKIFLGIPAYGYDWSLPHVSGESAATPLGNADAVFLSIEKKAAIEYDGTAAAPFFGYFSHDDKERREHKVWFQDARSVQSVLALIKEFGFYGLDLWNAMKYFPQLWLLLNGSYNIEKVMR